jgi:Ca2+-binding EF-hand superfamily protein
MKEFGVELDDAVIQRLMSNSTMKVRGRVSQEEFLELMTPYVRWVEII